MVQYVSSPVAREQEIERASSSLLLLFPDWRRTPTTELPPLALLLASYSDDDVQPQRRALQ